MTLDVARVVLPRPYTNAQWVLSDLPLLDFERVVQVLLLGVHRKNKK